MKTHAWMLCCLGLLAPLPFAGADEPPQGFVKITLGVEGEGLERIPLVGPILKQFVDGMEKPCAEQVQLQLPPPPECPACPQNERGVPLLSKLPYVNRLFKNVRPAPADEACETVEADSPAQQVATVQQFRFVGPDGLERIGVDFDCDAAQNCTQCQASRCPPPNAARAVAACGPQANCPAPGAVYGPQAGPYTSAPYPALAYQVLPAPLAMMPAQSFPGRDELIEALMEARVEAAVAQTALKAREESDAKQLELIKELLSSQVENARLTAKLELAAEKEKMLAELFEARVELTALQAHVARESEVSHRKRQRKDTEARRPAEAAEALR